MSVISEVKQRVDIVELVSEYVTLQKSGRNFKGLCPFHNEKYPSFFVFPEQQTWHCFGACGAGGDIFSFLMKKEGIDFSEALRRSAQRAGITLGPPSSSEKEKDEEKEKLFQLNEVAAQYYNYLLLDTQAGKASKDYLARRKVTSKTILDFRLGFSPDSWDAVKKYLISKGYGEKELGEAGLVIEKEDGNSYDRFRNRLMFPICDIHGRVTGFGARALDDSQPKYINSPQTAVFDKGSSLYGIDRAVSDIRKKNLAIIVEGYMDVLLPHQCGWQNVIASMGTSMTERQVGIIKRLTKNITLALDADAAGEEATFRDAEVLAHSLDQKTTPIPLWSGWVKYDSVLDAEIKVIALPSGKDPDEVVSENPNLWQNLVEQAIPVLDFAFQAVTSKIDINKARDKSLAIQRLLPLIEEIKDPVQRAHYISRLAHELRLQEFDVRGELAKLGRNRRKRQPVKSTSKPQPTRQLVPGPIEEYCLALLLQYSELHHAAQELSPEHFECTENREIFAAWQRSPDIITIRNKLDADLLEHLNYLLDKTFPPTIQETSRERQLALADCALRLQERVSRRLEAAREVMLNFIRENEGIHAELAKLEEGGIDLSRRIREITAAELQKKRQGIK